MMIGTVESCFRYPVKSFQGLQVDSLQVGISGIDGDRERAVIDLDSGRVLSAKRVAELLLATATDSGFSLPGGIEMRFDDPEVNDILSNWLGRAVALARTSEVLTQNADEPLAYEMTFEPTNDQAEYFQIPTPHGTFLDLAAVHLLSRSTLNQCAELRADLNFDARRFRPNLILDVLGEPFHEDAWIGKRIGIGSSLLLEISQPTVRCAMPLRAQPGLGAQAELSSQPELFAAMTELHTAFPNHLGVYANVVQPGVACIGDAIELRD
jgi:hypothetical protein